MEVKTGNWFECKVRYEKTQEDGMPKKVTETYVVDGINFGDAFNRMCENTIKQLCKEEFEIVGMNMARYKDIVTVNSISEKFFRVKINVITIDEKTDKQKKTPMFVLVQAADIAATRKVIDDDYMGGTMLDYEISSVSETKILDFYSK